MRLYKAEQWVLQQQARLKTILTLMALRQDGFSVLAAAGLLQILEILLEVGQLT
jgi:hypothetical protein